MILNGWKEIANHLGRGVRTVQRWEQLGLPVRRPNSRLRSAVICTSEELDAWVARCANGRTDAVRAPVPETRNPDFVRKLQQLAINAANLQASTTRVFEMTQLLRDRTEARLKQRAAARSA